MLGRRYFLFMITAFSCFPRRRSSGALLTCTSPCPAIDGLLGGRLLAGANNRLCIFGQNLEHVASVMFRDSAIDIQSLAICANEIRIDTYVRDDAGAGRRGLLMKTKSGETYAGGYITIVLPAGHGVAASSTEAQAWPTTPGWPTT